MTQNKYKNPTYPAGRETEREREKERERDHAYCNPMYFVDAETCSCVLLRSMGIQQIFYVCGS